MKDFQLIGLEKLLNSDTINKIYPMVDHIDIRMDEDFVTVLKINLLLISLFGDLMETSSTVGKTNEKTF